MKKILLFIIIIILIPILIIGFNNKNEIIKKIKYGYLNNKTIRVKIESTGEIKEVPLEEYVIGVVAGEMPASFSDEALKAQAVASRTYALNKCSNKEYDVTNTTKDQVYITIDEMKDKWKDNFEVNYNRIKNLVTKTNGEVVLFENKLIDAMFFSTSNGYTENSEDVFSNSLPYLKSVESSWDKTESPAFYSESTYTKEEFLHNLNLDINQDIDITNIERTKTGRVKSLYINKNKYSSSKIKEAFNLKSTSFKINIKNDIVTFSVSGFGHGVGLSQYGANGMAKQGFDYKSILLYYYKDCEIKKIN